MGAQESDVAARLIERLLIDPAFRATFRRDPAGACREAGLDALAEEMALGAGKAMMTLDVRESKSSLAGVMMAAAMEGIGLYQFSEHVLPHIEEIPGQVGDVLSRVDLPSIRGALGGGGGGSASADAALASPPGGGGDAAAAADAAGGGSGGAPGAQAAAPAPPAPPKPPEAPAEAAAPPEAAKPPEAAASNAAPKPAAPEADAPVAPAELPEGEVTPHAAEDVGPAGAKVAAAQAAPPTTAAPPPGAGAVPDAGAVGPAGGGGSSLGAAALSVAQTQRGVHEIGGANTGQQVDRYLAAAGVPPGNPWCASFVTWSLEQAGHKMPGGGWGGVATWVRNAEQGSNGLRIVSAEEARPGDIVAYDWGGQNDFGSDGHIGFLQSTVAGGQFSALEGNNADAVNVVPRHLGGGPNIVFIRADGNAPGGAAAAPVAAGPAPAAATASAAPAGPAAAPAAAAPAAGDAAQVANRESLMFKAVSAQEASKNRATMQFAAVKPSAAAAAAAAPPGAAAPPAGAVPPEAAGVAASAFAGGPDTYPGDDAPKAQLAAWLANEASKRGLPPELPVMASLVESGVQNLKGGDADSVGFFQMRVGIWNQGAYAGFPDDPKKQIDWFLDNAEAVKKQRIAAGKSVTDPNQYGDWIADVERPAEQYRGRYALRLDEARGLLRDAQPSGAAAPVAAAADVAASAPAPAGGHAPIDPSQFGAEGTGGAPDAEANALLQNKNIVLDANAVQDIKAGRIDPRVIAVLTKLSHEHKLTISCTCSDHSKFTAGGSISNHHYGRGVDIAAVDGVPVNSSNFDAREIAMELQGFDTSIRPDEIGSPWAISGPGYFTDAGHQDHLHVGFKQAIVADWKPPGQVAASAGAAPAVAPAAGVAVAPGVAPVAAAAAPPKPGDSMAFNAVSPGQAAKAAAARAGTAKPRAGDSLAFQAVKAPAAPAAPPAAAPPAAGAVPPEAAGLAASSFAGGPDAYPGDNASKDQLAAWLAQQASKRGLPPELPVMASLVESGLKNLNSGDADSVGLFQMRVGIWNQGAYAGFPDDPQKQADWFLDTAERVKAQRIAAGKSVTDPNQFGDWIADVERPAEQYRGRYQLKLSEAQALLRSAPAQPAGGAGVGVAVDAASAAAGSGGGAGPKALAAVAEARKYMGTAYHWGGSTPQTGFDCSGLMQWAYAKAGIQIPRVTYTQIADPNATPVDRANLRPGDLVFFSAGGDVHHVGMSLGGDKFLHAPHTGDVVKVSSLDEPYYKAQFAGGRRFDDAAPVAPAVAAPAVAPAAAPAPPAIEPMAVAKAQAAVARDAAEVRRNDSMLFKAVKAQEASKARATLQFMAAVDPKQQVKPAAAPAEAITPAPAAPVTPAPAPAAAPDAASAAAARGPAPDLSNVDLGDYPGDDASQDQLAKWMAKQAEKAGLPPELPVMASLVESGVKNLDRGDADSVGFFQMRVGIWNRGPYAGFPDNPKLQVKWFIDNALNVRRQRLAAGKPIDDPGSFGEWIADVERPAAQYRYRYQLRLSEARKLLS